MASHPHAPPSGGDLPSYDAALGSEYPTKGNPPYPGQNPAQGPPSGPAYPPYPQPGANYPPYPQPGGSYPPYAQGGQPGYPAGYGPPPQGVGYPQGPGAQYTAAPPQVVIVQQPMMMGADMFGEYPVRTVCPSCQQNVSTAVVYEAGSFAWLMCFMMCFLGLAAGCCLIPFFCQSCQDAIHSCPNCGANVGRYTRLQSRRRYYY